MFIVYSKSTQVKVAEGKKIFLRRLANRETLVMAGFFSLKFFWKKIPLPGDEVSLVLIF